MQTAPLAMTRNVTSDIQKEYDAFLVLSADKLEKNNNTNTTKDEENLFEETSPQAINKTDDDGGKTKEKYQIDPVSDAYESYLRVDSNSTEQSVRLLLNEC